MQYLFTNARDFSASAVVAALDGVVCAIRDAIPAQANAVVITIVLIAPWSPWLHPLRRNFFSGPYLRLLSFRRSPSCRPRAAAVAAEAPDRWDQDASARAGQRRPLLSNCASVYTRLNPPCRRDSVSWAFRPAAGVSDCPC